MKAQAELSLNHELQLDRVCREFEAAWQSGASPSLPAYLSSVQEDLRRPLFGELLMLDIDYQIQSGKSPQQLEYEQRWPEFSAEIAEAFSGTANPPADSHCDVSAAQSDTEVAAAPVAHGDGQSNVPPDEGIRAFHTPRFQVGQRIADRYVVKGVVGAGGFGTVYRVADTTLGRVVAMKIPHIDPSATNTTDRLAMREAKAAAILDHPNVCRIYDVCRHQGIPCIVMALVDGEPLSGMIAKAVVGAEFETRDVVALTRTIALALAEAHRKGIVHRDLKPHNILIDSQGNPVITDFGLASVADSTDIGLSTSGKVLGTTAYMSPEQARGHNRQLGPSTDIYSLGVVMYELLAGQRPFQGNDMEVWAMILTEPPTSLSELRPRLDSQLVSICNRAMAKQAGDRFADMDQFAAALSEWLEQPPAKSTNQSDRLATSVAVPAAESGAWEYRRSRWRLLLGSALLFGLIALAGFFHNQSDYGRLKIDSAVGDLSVQVSQGGKEIAVIDQSTGPEIQLRKGMYELTLKDAQGNIKLDTDRVELFRGGQAIVKVTRIPPVPENSREKSAAIHPENEQAAGGPGARPRPVPVSSDADRRAAEYALSIKARVLICNNENEVPFEVQSLPKVDFMLSEVHFGGNRKVTDAGLACFTKCRNLKVFSVGFTAITDAGLAGFENCTQLEDLSLDAPAITDAGLLHFAGCKNLKRVSLGNSQISDRGLAMFKGNQTLLAIQIDHSLVSYAGLENFADARDLEILSLQACDRVDDRACSVLKNCKKLKKLDLNNTKVDDAGVEQFADCKDLTELNLHNSQATGAVIALLGHWPQMNSLHLSFIPISDGHLAQLKEGNHLKELRIVSGEVSDAGVKSVARCTELVNLLLESDKITDNGLNSLAGLEKLRWLSLHQWGDPGITAAGVKKLAAALPDCTIEWNEGVIRPARPAAP